MVSSNPYDYARVKVNGKSYIEDLIIELNTIEKDIKQSEYWLGDKRVVMDALMRNDIPLIRKISDYFYRTNGIYQKAVNYYATMYKFDWYISAEVISDKYNEDKVVSEFIKTLDYFDKSQVKKMCGKFALSVIKNGVYYGYAYEGSQGLIFQELPWQWCRSHFSVKGSPAIEFNMKFFDKKFPNPGYRMKMLDLFPPEFKKGYLLYKQHKLPADDIILEGREWGSWYLLDPEAAFKFSIAGLNDLPLFINAIPEIIDLGVAQDIDKKRQLQQLLKIIVQQLPRDKNGDLIFDLDEAKDLHENAVQMLSKAVGVDVLTTFADIKGIDISDAVSSVKDTSLNNAERTVYNALGIGQNIFNPDGNIALEKSIAEDEGILKDLVYQFETVFNNFAYKHSENKKKWYFRFYFLYTTENNYQALSKLYKEQSAAGIGSKMLPQLALGQSQSFILNTAIFENTVLHLSEIMIPPLMSSTMTAEDIQNLGSSNKMNKEKSDNPSGRPSKEESELSEKTIQNKESMS